MEVLFVTLDWVLALVVALWSIVAVADGVRDWQAEALLEKSEQAKERRRATLECRRALNLHEAEKLAEAKAAASESTETKTGRAMLRLQHRNIAPGQSTPAPRAVIAFTPFDQMTNR